MTPRPSQLQLQTLKAVRDCEPPGITAFRLGRTLGITRAAAHSRLVRLNQLGLVREPGWLRYFALTPDGEEVLRDAS